MPKAKMKSFLFTICLEVYSFETVSYLNFDNSDEFQEGQRDHRSKCIWIKIYRSKCLKVKISIGPNVHRSKYPKVQMSKSPSNQNQVKILFKMFKILSFIIPTKNIDSVLLS